MRKLSGFMVISLSVILVLALILGGCSNPTPSTSAPPPPAQTTSAAPQTTSAAPLQHRLPVQFHPRRLLPLLHRLALPPPADPLKSASFPLFLGLWVRQHLGKYLLFKW